MVDDSRKIRNAALAVSCVSSFMTPYLGSAVNIALPAIGKDLGLDAVSLGWVGTAFIVAAASFLLPFGKLGDIIGRKKLYTVGVSVYVLFMGIASFAPTGSLLIASVVLSGIGASMIFGTGTAILTSVFPPAERGRALGISVAFTYAGLSLGPIIGGLLVRTVGWRGIYFVNVPVGLFALALAATRLKGEWKGEPGQRFDLGGSLLSALTLGLLVFGLSTLPAPRGFAVLAAAALALAAFVLQEGRTKHPLLPIALFRGNRTFVMSNLAALVNYSATFALTFFLSLYLQYIKALPAETAGLVLMAQPVLMTLFSPIAGRLSDSLEPRLLASAGMAIMTLMLALLATLGESTPIGLIVAELLAVGLGYAFFSAPNTNAVMGSVQPPSYGVASAILGTMRLVGQMLSMAIALLVLNLTVGRVAVTPEVHPQFLAAQSITLAICAALSFLGIFASLARGRRGAANVG